MLNIKYYQALQNTKAILEELEVLIAPDKEGQKVYPNVPHCVKSVRIQSYFGLYFPAFGLNTERYGISLRIPSECGKIRTRIFPNTDTFYAVPIIGKKISRPLLLLLFFS